MNLKNVVIAKDVAKKNHLFNRKRSFNILEDRISQINQKLGTAIQFNGIHHFKIIYGSNLIEIKYNSDPTKSFYYNSKQFLDLNFITKKKESKNKKIDKRRYKKIFNNIQTLRNSHEINKFIEAFRINNSRDNIWFHFKNSNSCHIDSKGFIKGKQFKQLGSEEEFHDEIISENKTFYDKNVEEIIYNIKKQLDQNLITSVQCYMGSGVITIVPKEHKFSWNISTLEEYLENPDKLLEKSENNSNNFKKRIFNILDVGEKLRFMDDELYLRILEGNVESGKILTSYSCGGTYFGNIEDILDFKNEIFF